MKITVDSREQERANRAKEYFEDKGHDVTICELEVGDYLFNKQTVFEYKRIDDFFSSLNDNRLWNQAINQYENFDYHYIIVEKNTDVLMQLEKRLYQREFEVYNDRYDGMVASLNVFTTVIEKEKEEECFKAMLKTAEKVEKNSVLIKKPEFKSSSPTTNWLTMIRGVGIETATMVVEEYDLNSLQDLLFLEKDDLTRIKGIGDKTAGLIIDSIKK